MSEPGPNGESKIGPFSLQVPPPSPNGSRVERASGLDPFRRGAPGFVVSLVLTLSTVPKVALLRSGSFAQWWRILIAVAAGGLATGLAHRRELPAAVSGAVVTALTLLLAYGLVRDQQGASMAVVTVLADVGRLLGWALVIGGGTAAAGSVLRTRVAARRASRTVKPNFPR